MIADLLDQEPIRAVDVGAARGVPPHWRAYLQHMRVDAFEPNEAECLRLSKRSHPHIDWHPTALAGAPGWRDLYVLATPTGSSFFPPAPEFVELFGMPSYDEVVDMRSLDCTTLAEQLDGQASPGPHLVKLDTQGSELEILQGLRPEQLDCVLAVELEIEFHQAYAGQPVFPEVHAFMQGAGFSLLDFRVQRAHLTAGSDARHFLRTYLSTATGTRELTAQLHAVDALYIRPLKELAATEDAALFGRFATILQMYRYYDGIFWLLDRRRARELFGAQGQFQLVRHYQRVAPNPKVSERTGPVGHTIRRARRGLSYALEHLVGLDGFDPPRVSWAHVYPPDS